jgi:hypothetical protein
VRKDFILKMERWDGDVEPFGTSLLCGERFKGCFF